MEEIEEMKKAFDGLLTSALQVNEHLKRETKKNEELQQRINNAIEYAESYLPNYDFDKTNLKKLVEILKGVKE